MGQNESSEHYDMARGTRGRKNIKDSYVHACLLSDGDSQAIVTLRKPCLLRLLLMGVVFVVEECFSQPVLISESAARGCNPSTVSTGKKRLCIRKLGLFLVSR